MAIYRAAVRTTVNATADNTAICAFYPGIRPAKLIEIKLYLRNTPALTASPTAGFAIGLTRTTALGTTSTTQVGRPQDAPVLGSEAGVGALVTAWSAQPTIETVDYDRAIGGTQIGYPVVFPFDRLDELTTGDSGAATSGVVIATTEAHGTGPIFDFIAIWDE